MPKLNQTDKKKNIKVHPQNMTDDELIEWFDKCGWITKFECGHVCLPEKNTKKKMSTPPSVNEIGYCYRCQEFKKVIDVIFHNGNKTSKKETTELDWDITTNNSDIF